MKLMGTLVAFGRCCTCRQWVLRVQGEDSSVLLSLTRDLWACFDESMWFPLNVNGTPYLSERLRREEWTPCWLLVSQDDVHQHQDRIMVSARLDPDLPETDGHLILNADGTWYETPRSRSMWSPPPPRPPRPPLPFHSHRATKSSRGKTICFRPSRVPQTYAIPGARDSVLSRVAKPFWLMDETPLGVGPPPGKVKGAP